MRAVPAAAAINLFQGQIAPAEYAAGVILPQLLCAFAVLEGFARWPLAQWRPERG